MVLDGLGWRGNGNCDGMGGDGMGSDGMGWDGMGCMMRELKSRDRKTLQLSHHVVES